MADKGIRACCDHLLLLLDLNGARCVLILSKSKDEEEIAQKDNNIGSDDKPDRDG